MGYALWFAQRWIIGLASLNAGIATRKRCHNIRYQSRKSSFPLNMAWGGFFKKSELTKKLILSTFIRRIWSKSERWSRLVHELVERERTMKSQKSYHLLRKHQRVHWILSGLVACGRPAQLHRWCITALSPSPPQGIMAQHILLKE